MLINPRRLAGLLDNAVACAKQGNKPYPYVLLLAEAGGFTSCGIGQHIMCEDTEPVAETTPVGAGMALHYTEAEQVAKAVRGVPGAGRKGAQVDVAVTDESITIMDGPNIIAEVADIGDEAGGAWELRLDAQNLYDSPVEPSGRFTVYDTSILAVLGKLKPANSDTRILLTPCHAGDTTMFRMGSLRGFLEGNRTPPGELGVLI